MLKFGSEPYLECSSRGDVRFSAFHARPKSLNGASIEQAYQAKKEFKFPDGSIKTGLTWQAAKGKTPINFEECREAYRRWWNEWVKQENLMPVLKAASGLQDMFGQKGHICQAGVLWDIRNQQEFEF